MTDTDFTPLVCRDISMPWLVQGLVHQFTDIWWQCETRLPELGLVHSRRDQIENEKRVNNYLKLLSRELGQKSSGESVHPAARVRVYSASVELAQAIWGLSDADIALIRSYGFLETAAEFARESRKYDPMLTSADIFQASRNVWSMNLMQVLLGLPVRMTPSIFAYSLLYPYTDNYIDDPSIEMSAKSSFNDRFLQRLEGQAIHLANRQEEKISALIGMIEEEFDRGTYPEVYASLHSIFLAQRRSMYLLHQHASPFEIDTLGICFEKGGTSVLADGYLVAGYLTAQQRELMFYYGTLTQLVDDLEDVESDSRAGLMTIYSQTALHWPLDAITNRTIHFAGRAVEAVGAVSAPGASGLLALLQKSLAPLLIGEAGCAARLYSRQYIQQIEPHFPLRFPFLRRQRAELSRRGVSLMGLIEILAGQN